MHTREERREEGRGGGQKEREEEGRGGADSRRYGGRVNKENKR